MDYSHFDWDWGQCEMAMDGHDSFDDSNVTVVYPPKNESGMIWDPNNRRGSMIGPSTINGDLVFIPTMTGEIYVHSVIDGKYIRTIYCPQYQWEYKDEKNETQYIPNREGTRSGQTMFGDYLLFYCGASYVHPTVCAFCRKLMFIFCRQNNIVWGHIRRMQSAPTTISFKWEHWWS